LFAVCQTIIATATATAIKKAEVTKVKKKTKMDEHGKSSS